MNCSRRSILESLCAFAGLLWASGKARAEEEAESDDMPAEEEFRDDETVDALYPYNRDFGWAKLVTYDDQRKIRKVTLVFPKDTWITRRESEPDSRSNPIIPVLQPMRAVTTNPLWLKWIEAKLSHSPLCYARREDSFGGWGGFSAAFGYLKVETTMDDFWIAITIFGFALDPDAINHHTLFFSGWLAEFVGLQYSKQTVKTFPAHLLEVLSGAEHVRDERKQFRSINTNLPEFSSFE